MNLHTTVYDTFCSDLHIFRNIFTSYTYFDSMNMEWVCKIRLLIYPYFITTLCLVDLNSIQCFCDLLGSYTIIFRHSTVPEQMLYPFKWNQRLLLCSVVNSLVTIYRFIYYISVRVYNFFFSDILDFKLWYVIAYQLFWMGRKKEDREAKADHKKARRLAKEAENDEDDSISLAHQLAPLGKAGMTIVSRSDGL